MLNEKGIDVVMEVDGSDPLIIQADKRLFAKVLSNLISNACHYSPAGEEIHIQIAKADDAVGFSIENTGVHIPEEEIPGLFEPFTRGSRHVTGRQAEAVWGFYCADGAGAASFFFYRLENTDDGVRFSIIFAVP
ncbi:MAG: sensor histidine kinase [Enterocloster bolteae]